MERVSVLNWASVQIFRMGQRTRISLPLEDCFGWFSRAQVVSYQFLHGKRVLVKEERGRMHYKEAHETLWSAFVHCHKSARRNKRLILLYLAPAALLCGKAPPLALLAKHGVDPLVVRLVTSTVAGDLPVRDYCG